MALDRNIALFVAFNIDLQFPVKLLHEQTQSIHL